MGMRQASDLLRPPAQARTQTPFARPLPSAGQINPAFLNTLDQAFTRDAEAARKAAEKQKAFVAAVFENEADIARIESEQELTNFKGVMAMEKESVVRQKYIDAISNKFNDLPEMLKQDPDFKLRLYKKASQFDKFRIPYVNSEARKIEDEAFKSRIVNDSNTLAENALDLPYMAQEGIPTLEKSLYQKLSRTYGEDPNRQIGNTTAGELIMAEMRAGVSAGITGAIRQQIVYEKFDLAEQTVTQHFNKITADDREKIQKMIVKGLAQRKDDMALTLAQETMQYLGDDAPMTKYQQHLMDASGGDSDLYNKSLSILEGRQKIIDRQKEKDYQQLEAEIYDEVIKGRPLSSSKLNKLPPDRRTSLIDLINKNNGGPATVTDYTKFNNIKNYLDRLPEDEFLSIDINKVYQKDISAQDRRSLIGWQDRVRKEKSGEIRDGQRWSNSIYETAARLYSNSNKIPESQKGLINKIAFEEYERLIAENPRITRTELVQKLKQSLYERGQTEVPKTGIISTPVNFIRGIFGMEPTKETVTSETLTPDRPFELDPTWVRSVQQERIKRGQKEFSEQELIRFFEYMQSRNPQFNISQPRP